MTNDETEKYLLVCKALEIIENGIKNRKEIPEIKRKIRDEIPYNENYFSSIFREILGISLAEYIQKYYFIEVYENLKEEGKIIKQREKYGGLNYFGYNFKRIFGVLPENADEKDFEKIELKYRKEELKELIDFFERTNLIKNYKIRKGTVSIEFDVKELLVFFLGLKSYIIPKSVVSCKNLCIQEKKTFLYLWDKFMSTKGLSQISMTLEEMVDEMSIFDLYDMENPSEYSTYFVYHCKLREEFKHIFEQIIDAKFKKIAILFINEEVNDDYWMIKKAIHNSPTPDSVKKLAYICNKTETEIYEIMWKMAKDGLLKLT